MRRASSIERWAKGETNSLLRALGEPRTLWPVLEMWKMEAPQQVRKASQIQGRPLRFVGWHIYSHHENWWLPCGGGGLILIRPGWASIIISNSLYSDRDFMGGELGMLVVAMRRGLRLLYRGRAHYIVAIRIAEYGITILSEPAFWPTRTSRAKEHKREGVAPKQRAVPLRDSPALYLVGNGL